MSSNSFQNFIRHEIETAHQNIDRLNTGIQRYSDGDKRAAGMRLVLQEQEKQLQFLEQLQNEARTFAIAMELVKQRMIQTEAAHQKAAERDLNSQAHSIEWWETLHQIEYFGEFIRRIRAWQTEFAQ